MLIEQVKYKWDIKPHLYRKKGLHVKKWELIELRKDYDGYYVAYMHNTEECRYRMRRFLYYTKKEVIYKLRHEYDCIVRKEV